MRLKVTLLMMSLPFVLAPVWREPVKLVQCDTRGWSRSGVNPCSACGRVSCENNHDGYVKNDVIVPAISVVMGDEEVLISFNKTFREFAKDPGLVDDLIDAEIQKRGYKQRASMLRDRKIYLNHDTMLYQDSEAQQKSVYAGLDPDYKSCHYVGSVRRVTHDCSSCSSKIQCQADVTCPGHNDPVYRGTLTAYCVPIDDKCPDVGRCISDQVFEVTDEEVRDTLHDVLSSPRDNRARNKGAIQ